MNHRLFVAIDFPEVIKEELQEIAFALPGAKWTRKENLHLTLQFIGEVDGILFDEIKNRLAAVHFPEFSLSLKELGYFSRGKVPKILWISVDNTKVVDELHKKIQSCLYSIGIKLDHNKFSAHITLARLQETPDTKLGIYLSEFGLFRTSTFPVNHFCLVSSKLTPKGAIYTIESKYDFSESSSNLSLQR